MLRIELFSRYVPANNLLFMLRTKPCIMSVSGFPWSTSKGNHGEAEVIICLTMMVVKDIIVKPYLGQSLGSNLFSYWHNNNKNPHPILSKMLLISRGKSWVEDGFVTGSTRLAYHNVAEQWTRHTHVFRDELFLYINLWF